jgi:4-hydroxymandelate oxidase
VYEQPSANAGDPRLGEFLTDMLGPYQVEFLPESLAAGIGQSYGEMGEPLIDALASPERPIDLLVLAFAVHDLRPGQATAPYLSYRCPGSPLAFSVCDQGVAAGFTALRLIQTYVRTGRSERALLLVMEQTALHYQPPRPAPVPDRIASAALLLERTGPAALGPVRQYPSVPPEQAGRRLADQVAALAADRSEVRLVVGAEYADDLLTDRRLADLVGQILIAPTGQPATGAWWEFAGGLPEWTEQRSLVLVADYDRPLGYLSICAADFGQDVPAEPALAASLAP